MEYLILCTVSLLAAALTFFSGFGLGTLLLPAFALFFPVELAIALTAVVHVLNNFLKLALIGKYADKKTALSFGLPAILGSLLGSFFLIYLASLKPLWTYEVFGYSFSIMAIKLVVAGLMIVFACFEFLPALKNLSFEKKYAPAGGLVSGFFGGLSGHQGALRTAFLARLGLSTKSFLGTGVVIACLVDFSRISVYSFRFASAFAQLNLLLLGSVVLAAFAGSFLGNRLVKTVTIQAVQLLVAIMLAAIAFLLALGWI